MNVHSLPGQDPTRADLLVAAAAEIFAERGFEAATVQQIASRAGVSTGLLYRYFPGKADLARAIVASFHEEEAVALAALKHVNVDPEAAIVAYVEGWVAAATEDPRSCALMAEIAGLAVRDGQVRADVTEGERHAVDVLSAALEQAGLPAVEARGRASLATCALDGITLRIAIEPTWDARPALNTLIATLRSTANKPRTTARRS
jgi:AcrR family transcriptional regulator